MHTFISQIRMKMTKGEPGQPLENKATEIFTDFQHSENTWKAIKTKLQTNMDKSCVRESIYKPVTKFPKFRHHTKR